jgi:hypothetical protein
VDAFLLVDLWPMVFRPLEQRMASDLALEAETYASLLPGYLGLQMAAISG